MLQQKVSIVVYLVSQWETFHRRPMREALARNLGKKGLLFCCNPPVSVSEAWKRRDNSRTAGLLPLNGPARLGENIYLGTPCVWIPGMGRSVRQINSLGWKIVSWQIKQALRRIAPPSNLTIAWTFRPEQLHCLGLSQEGMVVYECYDEYQLDIFDSTPLAQVADSEKILLQRADLVFVTARSLGERRKPWCRHLSYAPNGVAFEHFAQARNRTGLEAAPLSTIPRPRLGFVGNISACLDLELIEDLAQRWPDCSIVLVGPLDESARRAAQRWSSMSNIYLLGRVDFYDLPAYLKGFDLTLAPFRWNEFNYHVNPLKVWEYLAAGRPVVASSMSELESLADIIYLAHDRVDFLSQVDRALRSDNSERCERGISAARAHSWHRLTGSMIEQILACD